MTTPNVVPLSENDNHNSSMLIDILESIRVKRGLPALAGAIFTVDGVVKMAAAGVRKAGTHIPVTTDDLWHIGSCTKAMTALLAGTFVAEQKLSWDDTIISYFPELAPKVPPAPKAITIRQVLGHQAGLSRDFPFWKGFFLRGSPSRHRRMAVEPILQSPAHTPGTFHYSNNGYMLIGAVLEKISGKSWEDLMRERLFVPLRMDSAGFGGTGTTGQIDAPWPHFANGFPLPFNGPHADNWAYMRPAGGIHLSMADWAKFLADQLRGGNGRPALLPALIYAAIQSPGPSSDYGLGWNTVQGDGLAWGIVQREWAGGKILYHTGGNTLNFAVCRLGPLSGMGVLACCNQGGDAALTACNDAAEAMISLHTET